MDDAANRTSDLYNLVVSDVLKAVRIDWLADGVTQDVMDDLRSLWLSTVDSREASAPELLLFGPKDKTRARRGKNHDEDEDDFDVDDDDDGGEDGAPRPSSAKKFKVEPNPLAAAAAAQIAEEKAAAKAAAMAAPVVKTEPRELEEGEEALSSLSSSNSDVLADVVTDNKLLCQFKNVKKMKNRWKAVLCDGLVRVNGRDLLFKNGVANLKRW